MSLYHGLSDTELSTVARTILNWGAADLFAGEALAHEYGISDEGQRTDLIDAVDLRKKIDLLLKLVRSRDDTSFTNLVRELAKVHKDWGEDRNRLAHGSGKATIGGVVIVSAKKRAEIPVEELPVHEARSDYVASLAIRIRLIQTDRAGMAQGPSWPGRPL